MSQEAVDALVKLLDLEPIEVNIFRGLSPDEERQRVFGGQVAGQALVAAARTVEPDSMVHSLHAYFLRPGDTRIPILYMVDRIRDGLSFVTRRVTAVQHGRAIFSLSASFQVPEDGFEHSEAMPDVPGPDTLPTLRERWEELTQDDDRLAKKAENEFTLDLPADRFHLSVAPYLDRTHECFYHSLTTCKAELAARDVVITVVAETSGKVLVDETRASFDNGFVGLWLPRDIEGTLRISYGGKAGETTIATGGKAPTCLTTLRLA